MAKSLKRGTKLKWGNNNRVVIVIGPKKMFGKEPWIGVVGVDKSSPKPFYVKVSDLH